MSKEEASDNNRTAVFERKLKHYRQRWNWDCGVSCVLMVLSPESSNHFLTNFNEICKQEEFNKSTWTIDLCYLLKRFGVKHLFCTVTIGVHPGFTGQAFYEKVIKNFDFAAVVNKTFRGWSFSLADVENRSEFAIGIVSDMGQQDEERVKRKFTEASKHGITIKKTSLTCRDFVQHLSQFGPIILLTNASLLTCDMCRGNWLTTELRSCLPWSTNYAGHYIVLTGYDLMRKSFFYRNPTYKDRVCCIPFTALDQARLSYGTDEDAILIFDDKNNPET